MMEAAVQLLGGEVGGGAADASLSVHNATWFLDLLEKANLEDLGDESRRAIVESKLRAKPKHRTAILFQDDERFVLNGEDEVAQDTLKFAKGCQDEQDAHFDYRVWLIRESCKRVLDAYSLSIRNAPLRSCVWSALKHRADFHSRRCGIEDVCIIENNTTNKKAMLCVQGQQISRSNFTKIARQLLENANASNIE